ncbi:Retrovirus-related Pol polyprotein from transposon TNT 1-94 [Morella rubra]|uniref:Retrovirus-related Pol polyprotein from transposon TNT 1-94 n=1 Tax=Morella rubra TaxID=262757 RepID=A0A6A1VUJ1_9ROSI|nr:Retrovirus-related Pol polyprotein from transposon TNT 1-94 [Morella rubra]
MAAVGRPLTSPEFNSYLLAGLGTEYDSLVTSVTTRMDPSSSKELFSHLLTHEARLTHQATSLNSTEITVNATTKASGPSFRSGRSGRNKGSFRGGSRGRGGRGWNGAGSSYFPEDRPACQVCFKPGHTTLQCYNRFNQAFQALPPPSMAAHYSSLPSHTDSSWYLDSAATNHMTNDFSNLTIYPTEYFGEEPVRVGDGSTLPIHHTGGSTIPTAHGNLLLHNLLHVPSLTKNLISVRQFCEDNSVYFEFHSHFFCVKELRTRKTLLHGPTRNGLYTLPPSGSPGSSSCASSGSPQACVGEQMSITHWHQRLGHPSLVLVRRLLRQFQLPVSSSSTGFQLCSACCQAKSHALPFPRLYSVCTRPFQLIFMDVWGPTPVLSQDGFRFYLSIVDAFSRYT